MNPTTQQMMLYSTTRLTAVKNGVGISTGSGFFYDIDLGGNQFVNLIITNKHVVEGADQIHFASRVIRPDGSEFSLKCAVTLNNNTLFLHSKDGIDLCALVISGIREQLPKDAQVRSVSIHSELIPSIEEWATFDALEEITMVGCPTGIYDTVNDLPIFRRGHTATPLSVDHMGEPKFIIDMACFPGSSGSPIFLYNSSVHVNRKTNTLVPGERLYFVGVLHAGPLATADGDIIMTAIPKVQSRVMMHLGYAIKSSELSDIENQIRAKVATM